MTPVQDPQELRNAAITTRRVRVRGVITETGDGYSGTYRNRWLLIQTRGARLRITASPSSRLGTARQGTVVDVVVTLTGLVDLSANVYYAQHPKLVELVSHLT